MKKTLSSILIFLSLLIFGQQEKYTKYLNSAMIALDENNFSLVNDNLRFFAAAVEKDNLIPENLSPKNLDLFRTVIYEASLLNAPLDEDFKEKIILFLSYDASKSPQHMSALGYAYLTGNNSEANWTKGTFWLKEAAKNNEASAYYNLGYAYSQYIGKQDFVKSADYYATASEMGIAQANYAAGFLYDNQIREYKKARYWYLRGSETGDAGAMFALGNLYFKGLGGEKDFEKSLTWYKKASDKGFSKASALVGYQYHAGVGTSINIDEAEKYYLISARGDNSDSMYNLSVIYSDTDSKKYNIDKAVFWAKKSCLLGNSNACQGLKDIQNAK